MVSDLPIADRRGFELSDFESDRLGILMVRSPIELVSAAYVELFGGALETGISKHRDGVCLHQYKGHDWTIIGPFGVCSTQSVIKISERLQTRCLYLTHDDTGGASSYEVFDQSNCIEEFHWGTDYTEEIWEISPDELLAFAEAREAEGNPLPTGWDPRKWDVYHVVDQISRYKFRGQSLTATPVEVVNVHCFLDRLFRAQDAWLPDWEHIPWQKTIPPKSEFARVDCVTGAVVVNEALAYLTSLYPNMEMTADGGIILAETETKDLSSDEVLEF